MPIELRLPRRDPFDFAALLAFLGPRAIPGVEEVDGDTYRRSLRLPAGPAIAEVRDDGSAVRVALTLSDPRDLAPAVARIRRLLDLDADPLAVAEVLGADPVLARYVAANPGRRAPGAVDGLELAVRADRRAAGVGRVGDGGRGPDRGDAGNAATRPHGPRHAPLPRRGHARRRAGCRAPGAHRPPRHDPCGRGGHRGRHARPGRGRRPGRGGRPTQAIPGIGPWTAGYVALRALGDPDQLLVGDLAIRKAAARLGLPDDQAALAKVGARWAPWRSYANHHLWASLALPVPAPTMELDQ